VTDFPAEIGSLESARLLKITPESLELTPRGMFYADSVAGLLASRRVQESRAGLSVEDPNASGRHWMG